MQFTVFLPGAERPKKVELLIKLTGIRSEDVIGAINDHLVKGSPINVAAALNGIDESNFRRALNKLEVKAQLVEEIKEIEWPDYQVTRFKKVS